MKTYALIYCPCGQLSTGGEWKQPTITLAEFLSHMRKRQIQFVRLLDFTCPDCFQSRSLGVYATVEPAATEDDPQLIAV